MVAELLAGVDVGDVHLDEGQLGRLEGVAQGQAVVGQGAGVYQDAVGAAGLRLQEIDDLTLVVRLEGRDLGAEFAGPLPHPVLDLFEGDGAVYLRLSLAEQVEVRAVDQQYAHLRSGGLPARRAGAPSTALDYRTRGHTRASAAPR